MQRARDPPTRRTRRSTPQPVAHPDRGDKSYASRASRSRRSGPKSTWFPAPSSGLHPAPRLTARSRISGSAPSMLAILSPLTRPRSAGQGVRPAAASGFWPSHHPPSEAAGPSNASGRSSPIVGRLVAKSLPSQGMIDATLPLPVPPRHNQPEINRGPQWETVRVSYVTLRLDYRTSSRRRISTTTAAIPRRRPWLPPIAGRLKERGAGCAGLALAVCAER